MGAFVVGVAASLAGRARRSWAPVVSVPAILLLVPGSIGFRSLAALLAQETVDGVQTAVTMFLTATSIVVGLLLASTLTSGRLPRPHKDSSAS